MQLRLDRLIIGISLAVATAAPALAADLVAEIAAGGAHTCALTTAGGAKCWGANDAGQLGDDTTTTRLTPVHVNGLTSGVAAIAAGDFHTCALTTAGGVKCWGANDAGQLGDDTTTTRLTPVHVNGLTSGVAAIAAGDFHTCALTTAGGVKCWGANDAGQLGDDTTTTRLTPVHVNGLTSGVAAIAAGDFHTCALTTAGGVKCWGANDAGQLGDDTTTTRLTPVHVNGLTSGVTAIAAGGFHTCALTTASGVKCWGANDAGQLGDDTTTTRLTPVHVNGLTSGVAAIAAGAFHTCAVTDAGGGKCWGANDAGQLGDGTTTSRLTAVHVSWLTSGVAAIAAGDFHTCALTDVGGLRCWGANDAGQLGDDTTTTRLTPVHVSALTGGVAGGSAPRDTVGFATSTANTTTATSTTTTTPAGCGGVPAGPTFLSIDCRLNAFIAAVQAEPALGALAPKLADTLGKARVRKQDAEALCANAGAKHAGNRLRQAGHKMTQYVHQLRGRHARKQIPAAVRDPLVAAGQSLQSDLLRLRQELECPAAPTTE